MKKQVHLDTALTLAVEARDARGAARVLTAGANPNLDDGTGRVLFARVVESGQLAMVMAFLEGGVDVRRPSKRDGQS